MRPRAEPEPASISITMSPFLPPLSERASPTWCAMSPRAAASSSSELEGVLLERPALAGALLALGGELGLGLVGVAQSPHLGLELGDLLDQLRLRVARAVHRAHDLGLEVRQRVVAVLGGELPQQVLAGVGQGLGDDLLDLVLHGGVAVAPEVAGDQLRELVAVGVEDLGHRAPVLADEALELLLEVVPDLPCPLGEGVLRLG